MGYRFVAPVTVVATPAPPPQIPPLPPRVASRRWFLAIPAALLLLSGAIFWRGLGSGSAGVAPRAGLTQITHLLGEASHPSFSPDGTQVAFQWRGDERGNFAIYTIRIGSDDMHRLTATAADDTQPAWSPDGRDIAFLRDLPTGQSALMLAPVLGGPERRVAILPRLRSFCWPPSGNGSRTRWHRGTTR